MLDYVFKRLSEIDNDIIRELFVSVFTQAPWYDDWSDEVQLRLYIHDLIGQSNSLAFGLFEGEKLIAISLGHTRHWYSGTEYFIDELCVDTAKQGSGVGTLFAARIENACRELKLVNIFLLTEDNVAAYEFYKKLGFYQLEHSVAFAKSL